MAVRVPHIIVTAGGTNAAHSGAASLLINGKEHLGIELDASVGGFWVSIIDTATLAPKESTFYAFRGNDKGIESSYAAEEMIAALSKRFVAHELVVVQSVGPPSPLPVKLIEELHKIGGSDLKSVFSVRQADDFCDKERSSREIKEEEKMQGEIANESDGELPTTGNLTGEPTQALRKAREGSLALIGRTGVGWGYGMQEKRCDGVPAKVELLLMTPVADSGLLLDGQMRAELYSQVHVFEVPKEK